MVATTHSALVTGGGTGIGLACAEKFVAQGAAVGLLDARKQAVAGRVLASPMLTFRSLSVIPLMSKRLLMRCSDEHDCTAQKSAGQCGYRGLHPYALDADQYDGS